MRLICLALLLSSCTLNYKPRIEQKPLSKPEKGVTLVCDSKCTEAEKSRIKAIERKLNETINSKCFSDYLLAGGRKWHEMDKETPISLLVKMRSHMVLMVNYFYADEWWILGFEQAGEPVVHINRNSLARLSLGLCQEAAIAAHEASHAQGFMHRGNSPDDYNSWTTAPYIISHAFESRSEDYRNGGCCVD
jgi:hypothetical protein